MTPQLLSQNKPNKIGTLPTTMNNTFVLGNVPINNSMMAPNQNTSMAQQNQQVFFKKRASSGSQHQIAKDEGQAPSSKEDQPEHKSGERVMQSPKSSTPN